MPARYAMTERDGATGLDHTWFRKNENRAGRWTSPDPYNGSISLGDPQSFNRYSFVENEPTNFVDPSGLMQMHCEWRYVIPETCTTIDGETSCGFDWARAGMALVCTLENSGGRNGPPSIDGGLLGGPTASMSGVSGGGKEGECKRIRAQIEKKMAEFDKDLAKYDPVADYAGGRNSSVYKAKSALPKSKRCPIRS